MQQLKLGEFMSKFLGNNLVEQAVLLAAKEMRSTIIIKIKSGELLQKLIDGILATFKITTHGITHKIQDEETEYLLATEEKLGKGVLVELQAFCKGVSWLFNQN